MEREIYQAPPSLLERVRRESVAAGVPLTYVGLLPAEIVEETSRFANGQLLALLPNGIRSTVQEVLGNRILAELDAKQKIDLLFLIVHLAESADSSAFTGGSLIKQILALKEYQEIAQNPKMVTHILLKLLIGIREVHAFLDGRTLAQLDQDDLLTLIRKVIGLNFFGAVSIECTLNEILALPGFESVANSAQAMGQVIQMIHNRFESTQILDAARSNTIGAQQWLATQIQNWQQPASEGLDTIFYWAVQQKRAIENMLKAGILQKASHFAGLQAAIIQNDLHALDLLAQYGINIYAVDEQGHTPLEYARSKNASSEIINWLIAHGAHE